MIALDDARRVIAAAEDKAREIGPSMNIAVLDAGGNLTVHPPKAASPASSSSGSMHPITGAS